MIAPQQAATQPRMVARMVSSQRWRRYQASSSLQFGEHPSQKEDDKMQTEEQSKPPCDRAQLNERAEQWRSADSLPVDVTWESITSDAHALYEELNETIESLEETVFTQPEAYAWALRRSVDNDDEQLTTTAVAVVMSAPNSPFSLSSESAEDADSREMVTEDDVRALLSTAKRKFENTKEEAVQMAVPGIPEDITNPELIWVDQRSMMRLSNQSRPSETTLEAVMSRLLDEVETQRSLADLLNAYIDVRGHDNVAKITVVEETLGRGVLNIIAHPATMPEEKPAAVVDTDTVEIADRQYDLLFDEDPYNPPDYGRIVLYASEEIYGDDAVTIEEGVNAARKQVQELEVTN